jgi:hypothetical protein
VSEGQVWVKISGVKGVLLACRGCALAAHCARGLLLLCFLLLWPLRFFARDKAEAAEKLPQLPPPTRARPAQWRLLGGRFLFVLFEEVLKRFFQEVIEGTFKINGQFLGKLKEPGIYAGRKHLLFHTPQDTKKQDSNQYIFHLTFA